jgi:hypothetical protein
MLNTHNYQPKVTPRWESSQQPAQGSEQSSDYLRLRTALDEGWRILEVTNFLAHGKNAEGRGYLLTLAHPRLSLVREWNVARRPEIVALLALEGVPGFNG